MSKLIIKISFLNLGQLWMLKTFLPRMIEMDRGIIVSLTSIAGYVGAPNMVPYAATKFAVRGNFKGSKEMGITVWRLKRVWKKGYATVSV